MKRISLPALVAVVGLLLAPLLVLGRAGPVEANAELISDLTPGVQPGTIRLSVTNVGDVPLWIEPWGTPFDDAVPVDVLDITRTRKGWPDEERVAFIGPLIKRSPPAQRTYLRIEPNQSRFAEIQVARWYAIDSTARYRITYTGTVPFHTTAPKADRHSASESIAARSVGSPGELSVERSSHRHWLISSESLELTLRADVAERASDSATRNRSRPARYVNCDIDRIPLLEVAVQEAERITRQALQDLDRLDEDQRRRSPRYALWFGAYAAERFEQVHSRYAAIDDVLQNRALSLNCHCDAQYAQAYAYVRPDRPYEVNLCNAFWAAPNQGQDSRGGTLVHEVSHFDIVADTDDTTYGQSDAQALAQRAPELAVKNADSLEYFAENTPAVPILPLILPPDESGEFDDPPLSFIELETDIPATGTLDENQSHFFHARGATSVELSHDDGDADLYVYNDANLSSPTCIANSAPGQEERCFVDANARLYIQVRAAERTGYQLLARAVPYVNGSDDLIRPLPFDQTVRGEVSAGHLRRYSIDGPARVRLTPIRGDADLYLFSTPEPRHESLLCRSYRRDLASEDCTSMNSVGTVYAMVYGFGDSDFQLIARPGSQRSPENQAQASFAGSASEADSRFGLGASEMAGLVLLAGWVLRRRYSKRFPTPVHPDCREPHCSCRNRVLAQSWFNRQPVSARF